MQAWSWRARMLQMFEMLGQRQGRRCRGLTPHRRERPSRMLKCKTSDWNICTAQVTCIASCSGGRTNRCSMLSWTLVAVTQSLESLRCRNSILNPISQNQPLRLPQPLRFPMKPMPQPLRFPHPLRLPRPPHPLRFPIKPHPLRLPQPFRLRPWWAPPNMLPSTAPPTAPAPAASSGLTPADPPDVYGRPGRAPAAPGGR